MASARPQPPDLFAKHLASGVLLDTNLLLLLALGGTDHKLIGRGRLSNFVVEDFRELNKTVAIFQHRLTTPNILTEVDDLGRKDAKGREVQFRNTLRKLELVMIEKYIPSRLILSDIADHWLGLADSVSLKIAKSFLLLTTDAELWSQARRSKVDAVNWNHIRQQWL